MSILIIGDTLEQRIYLRTLLEKEGFRHVILAETIRQASEYLGLLPFSHPHIQMRERGMNIDLILMGLQMPDMSGIEACRIIKSTGHLHDIPVIMVSDISDLKNLKLAFAVGATDYIVKPVQETELLARVRSSLKLKHEMDIRKARERELTEMTQQLEQSKQDTEKMNEKLMESLRYAQVIQNSLLPNSAEVNQSVPNNFFIWIPRDIVSGDILFADFFRDGFVIAVIDCTGHGVPGAFLTMIASSALRRIIRDEGGRLPAQVLNRLNVIVKTTLRQDTEYAIADNGMDAGICFIRKSNNTLIFSGAKLPLIYVHNRKVTIIKGDRQNIGYKHSRRSDMNFNFTNHTIKLEKGMSFYIYTDGFTDQLGGDKNLPLGSRRFRNLLKEIAHLPFHRQREILVQSFNEYKGDNEMQDDVTLLGFGF